MTRKNSARAFEGGEGRSGSRSRINQIDFGLITDDSEGPPEIRAQTHPHQVHPNETLHDSPNIKQHERKTALTWGSSWCGGNSFGVFRESIQKSALIAMEERKCEKRLEV